MNFTTAYSVVFISEFSITVLHFFLEKKKNYTSCKNSNNFPKKFPII